MGLLVALIVGAIVGWIAGAITGRREGLLGSIAIGVVGSIIGGLLANVFGSGTSYLAFTWASFMWSLLGAVIFAAVLNMVQHSRTHGV